MVEEEDQPLQKFFLLLTSRAESKSAKGTSTIIPSTAFWHRMHTFGHSKPFLESCLQTEKLSCRPLSKFPGETLERAPVHHVEAKLLKELDVNKRTMLVQEVEHSLNVWRKKIPDLRTPASPRLGGSAVLDC
jgi:hypothetical protein